jgi:hypothetical protein
MKRFLITVLCLGLASCTHQQSTVKPPTPVLSVPDKTLSSDKWQISIPADWQQFEDHGLDVAFFYTSPDHNHVVTLSAKPYGGSIDEFVYSSLNQIKENGLIILDLKQLDVSNQIFYKAVISKETSTNYLWLTVKNGTAFGLVCGGMTFDNDLDKLCNNYFSSLVLK